MADERAVLVKLGTPAAAALFALGYVAGDADFGPKIEAARNVGGMRQILRSDDACKDLGAIAGEAIASDDDPAWCYQLNGMQVPAGHELCDRLDALAGAVPVMKLAGEGGTFRVVRIVTKPITDDAVCAQVEVAARVTGRFVAD